MIFPFTGEIFCAKARLKHENRVRAKERNSLGLCMFLIGKIELFVFSIYCENQ